ncbi:hypothetical protein B0T22DRAFT_480355 [Podospora appendiculata]|uniref:Uncharacterized protein n=1 Tax=Podospora appendiculata TaxID=314037 RepID=A0AAE1CD24_9PEZI|nr:hypothetical protein B0T22DRAFT_480355 [Podospora appendiculata]
MDAPNSDYYPRASLLGIPPELRLMVYAHVLSPILLPHPHSFYLPPDDFPRAQRGLKIRLLRDGRAGWLPDPNGKKPAVPPAGDELRDFYPSDAFHRPWALARVCRLVAQETAPLLAAIDISTIYFHFHGFSTQDLHAWFEMMGDGRLEKVRVFSIVHGSWACRCNFDFWSPARDRPWADESGQEQPADDTWWSPHAPCAGPDIPAPRWVTAGPFAVPPQIAYHRLRSLRFGGFGQRLEYIEDPSASYPSQAEAARSGLSRDHLIS